MNVCDLIAHHAARLPDHPALIQGERVIAYRELDMLVRRTASHLTTLGVGAGQRVGCALKEDIDHVVAMLGILRAGGAYLPLDWRAPPTERDRIAEVFEADMILAPTGMPAGPKPTHIVDDAWHAAVAAATDRWAEVGGAAPGFIGLSSGTTGSMTAAVMSHHMLFFQGTGRWNSLDHPGPRRYFSALPLFYTAGRHMVLDHLMYGATVIVYPALFGPEEFVEQIRRHAATLTMAVPTAFRWLLEQPAANGHVLPPLQAVLSTAAAMQPEEKLAVLRHVTPRLFDSYGATGAGWIGLAGPDDIARHPDSVGRCAFLVEREVVDDAQRPVQPGTVGRFRCRGPGVVGSDGKPESWLYTGELACEDDEGLLFLQGREAELIICGGANVLPQEVERVLMTHDAVVEAAVVGWPSPTLGEEVAAFVVLREPTDEPAIIRHCRERLAPHKVPRSIFVVPDLPRTTSGKVRKTALVAELPPLEKR